MAKPAMTADRRKNGSANRPKARGVKTPATVSRPALLIDGSDKVFRQMVHDTLAFTARIQEVRSRFGQFLGLPGTQYTILMAIAHRQDEGVGVNAIADHLHLSGAFVTTEINKLVAAGLVEKQAHPNDRRRVLLRITDTARDRLAKLSPIQMQGNDALFDCLDANAFQSLRTIMAQLVICGDNALRLLDYLGRLNTVKDGPGPVPARSVRAARS